LIGISPFPLVFDNKGTFMVAAPPLPPPEIPAAVIQQDVRYYAIEGRNEPELVAQMNAKGYPDGRNRYWAYTSPKLNWNFDVKDVGGSCVLSTPGYR
jgi:predicted secreted Zn-dependent protease